MPTARLTEQVYPNVGIMTLAYLLNQYPMPSQTFVRRELQALEADGLHIIRFSIRPATGEIVDPDDLRELDRTRTLLGPGGGRRLLRGVLEVIRSRPGRFSRAFAQAIRLGRRTERGLGVHLVYLAEACVLVKWFEAAGVKHVHTHFGTNAPMVALFVQTLGGPPFSFTVHGPEEFDRPVSLRLREKVGAARFVVAISSFGRSQILRWTHPRDWAKVHVVRCGVDASYVEASPASVPDVARLVSVGRLSEQKGQLTLVDAAALLRDAGVGVDIVLAGEGPMRAEIEEAIAAHGLSGQVRITGWLDNASVRDELRAARALVLPSFAEGLPVALMEAMALGRPVITTSIAGIPELVDSTCGWVVPAGSVEGLAQAMIELINTPIEQLEAMGRAGRARVLVNHDVQISAASLRDLIEPAVAPRRASFGIDRSPAAP